MSGRKLVLSGLGVEGGMGRGCFLLIESAFHPWNYADMAKTGSVTALLAFIWAHNLHGWTSSNI